MRQSIRFRPIAYAEANGRHQTRVAPHEYRLSVCPRQMVRKLISEQRPRTQAETKLTIAVGRTEIPKIEATDEVRLTEHRQKRTRTCAYVGVKCNCRAGMQANRPFIVERIEVVVEAKR